LWTFAGLFAVTVVVLLALVPLPGEACHGAGEFGFCLNTDACTRVVCIGFFFSNYVVYSLEILHKYSIAYDMEHPF
jgi:hypothetical protein